MAQDATGTPSTNWGIPKFNTAVDPPTGKGTNAMIDFIDGIIIPDLLLDAKGDLIVATAADVAARLAVGADDTVLTADSSQAAGMRWAAAGGGGSPTGAVTQYAGSTAPTGWLLCDGAAVSRTTFADLFTAIGTAYGVGDGSTTFNVPDMRGRVAVGKGSNAAVNTLGNSDGVAEANRRPQHRHTPHSHSVNKIAGNAASAAGATNIQGDAAGTSGTADGGSGNANDSLDAPAYLVFNYIIKT